MNKKDYLSQMQKGLSHYAYRDRLLEELSDHIDDSQEKESHNLEHLGNHKDMKNTINSLYSPQFIWIFIALFFTTLAIPTLSIPFLDSLVTQVGAQSYQINILPIVLIDLLITLFVIPIIGTKFLSKQAIDRKFIAKGMFTATALARLLSAVFILISVNAFETYDGSLMSLFAIILLSSVANGVITGFVALKSAQRTATTYSN